jgi:hypothetical protein
MGLGVTDFMGLGSLSQFDETGVAGNDSLYDWVQQSECD